MKNLLVLALGLSGLAAATTEVEPIIKDKRVQLDDSLVLDVKCETSDDSPYQHHIIAAASKIWNGPDTHCYQHKIFGDHCTKIEASEGAIVRVCNKGEDHTDPEASMVCLNVENAARAIAEHCANEDGRAGGESIEWTKTDVGWKKNQQWVDVVRNW